jgi:fatty acid desaturase
LLRVHAFSKEISVLFAALPLGRIPMTARSIELDDPEQAPPHDGLLARMFTPLLSESRDWVFVRFSLTIVCVVYPLATYLFLHFNWWVALVYAIIVGRWNGPVTLMLHNTSHRNLFRRGWLNYFIPIFITPFFGNPSFTYYGHHIGMHHPENNLEDDLSSTMPYQRDSFLHFLHYFARFAFLGLFEVNKYLFGKKRGRMAYMFLLGELGFYAMCAALARYVDARATFVVFIFPVIVMRFGMMTGNWGQHAFLNPERPDSGLGNSITCINAGYNKTCFNDGYHIGHHLDSRMHWTEMPNEFRKNLKVYADADAIVFRGVDFFIVSLALWAKRYRWLASKYVQIGERDLSEDEIIAKMKSRLLPVKRNAEQIKQQKQARRLERRRALAA